MLLPKRRQPARGLMASRARTRRRLVMAAGALAVGVCLWGAWRIWRSSKVVAWRFTRALERGDYQAVAALARPLESGGPPLSADQVEGIFTGVAGPRSRIRCQLLERVDRTGRNPYVGSRDLWACHWLVTDASGALVGPAPPEVGGLALIELRDVGQGWQVHIPLTAYYMAIYLHGREGASARVRRAASAAGVHLDRIRDFR